MATKAIIVSKTIKTSALTTAEFVAWNQAMSQAFQAVGLVQTADTGQVNWGTVTVPTVNTYSTYEMYRFNDLLQATSPIYIRVNYVHQNFSTAFTPILHFWIGIATDGAGNLTSNTNLTPVLSGTASLSPFYLGSAILGAPTVTSDPTPAYFSGDGSRLQVCACTTTGQTGNVYGGGVLSIARTKNSSGADTGEGLMIHNHLFGSAEYHKYMDCRGAFSTLITANRDTYPSPETGTGLYPCSDGVNGLPGMNLGLYPCLVNGGAPRPWDLGLLRAFQWDLGGQTTNGSGFGGMVKLNYYGSDHYYMYCGFNGNILAMNSNVNLGGIASGHYLMRYE